MKALLYLLVDLSGLAGRMILAMKTWTWFVVPMFGLPPLTWLTAFAFPAIAAGLGLGGGYRYFKQDEDEERTHMVLRATKSWFYLGLVAFVRWVAS